MTCTCLTATDELLHQRADTNTTLDVALLFDRQTACVTTRAKVATTKRDAARRQKPVSIIADYCPFCGAKYPEGSER